MFELKVYLRRFPLLKMMFFMVILFSIGLIILYDYKSIHIKVPTFDIIESNETLPIPFYDINSLPTNDFTTLIDLENFNFLLKNVPCNESNTSPLLLILIHSAPQHFDDRMTIRNTWGRCNESFKLIFLLGTVDDSLIQKMIFRESVIFNDIVQGNFYDSYRNLTYKHVMGFKWTTYYCTNAKYILKTDDDTFVNTPYLLKYLSTDISSYGPRRLILCLRYVDATVKRSHRSKWRVSQFEYAESKYPPYCAGFGIIYSRHVLFDLYKKAQESNYFWIDDVLITGILASRLHLTSTHLDQLILSVDRFDAILHGDTTDLFQFIFGPPNLTILQIKNMWALVHRFYNLSNLNKCY